jgi:hypothetical protein
LAKKVQQSARYDAELAEEAENMDNALKPADQARYQVSGDRWWVLASDAMLGWSGQRCTQSGFEACIWAD